MRAHPLEEVPVEIAPTAVRDGAKRVDRHDAVDTFWVLDGQVEGEVAAPGVTNHERAADSTRVEYANRILDVRLYAERSGGGARGKATLLVADRPKRARQHARKRLRVVGHRPTVQKKRRHAFADVPDDELTGGNLDRKLPRPSVGRAHQAIVREDGKPTAPLRFTSHRRCHASGALMRFQPDGRMKAGDGAASRTPRRLVAGWRERDRGAKLAL